MKNIYLEKKSKETCNGCGICIIGCPVNAIYMKEDEEGFFYPEIDENKCIRCDNCKKICSNYNDFNNQEDAYMVINKNREILKKSASGGMFYILAKYVIDKMGVVFGVEYSEDLNVKHNYYETLDECKKFQGSKYVRSEIGDSYQNVEKFLKDNRWVLFTGTPCQCNALRTYLNKDYPQLITCEIICHANPSQKVFKKYVKNLEENYNKKVIDIKFRDKDTGWKNATPVIYFEDGSKIEEKTFYLAFVNELFNRPSCHKCVFSNTDRGSDFTIGDFWGIEKVLPNIEDDNSGISLITVNTNKAKKIFNDVVHDLKIIKVNKEEAFKYNHHYNIAMHKNRKKFFENLDNKLIINNIEECLKISYFKKILRRCKYLLKKIIKR